jgi:hypothetical protein
LALISKHHLKACAHSYFFSGHFENKPVMFPTMAVKDTRGEPGSRDKM